MAGKPVCLEVQLVPLAASSRLFCLDSGASSFPFAVGGSAGLPYQWLLQHRVDSIGSNVGPQQVCSLQPASATQVTRHSVGAWVAGLAWQVGNFVCKSQALVAFGSLTLFCLDSSVSALPFAVGSSAGLAYQWLLCVCSAEWMPLAATWAPSRPALLSAGWLSGRCPLAFAAVVQLPLGWCAAGADARQTSARRKQTQLAQLTSGVSAGTQRKRRPCAWRTCVLSVQRLLTSGPGH